MAIFVVATAAWISAIFYVMATTPLRSATEHGGPLLLLVGLLVLFSVPIFLPWLVALAISFAYYASKPLARALRGELSALGRADEGGGGFLGKVDRGGAGKE